MGWWGGGVVGSSGALALPGSLVLRLRRLILEAEPPGPIPTQSIGTRFNHLQPTTYHPTPGTLNRKP